MVKNRGRGEREGEEWGGEGKGGRGEEILDIQLNGPNVIITKNRARIY